jgi:hypothetical protein
MEERQLGEKFRKMKVRCWSVEALFEVLSWFRNLLEALSTSVRKSAKET